MEQTDSSFTLFSIQGFEPLTLPGREVVLTPTWFALAKRMLWKWWRSSAETGLRGSGDTSFSWRLPTAPWTSSACCKINISFFFVFNVNLLRCQTPLPPSNWMGDHGELSHTKPSAPAEVPGKAQRAARLLSTADHKWAQPDHKQIPRPHGLRS